MRKKVWLLIVLAVILITALSLIGAHFLGNDDVTLKATVLEIYDGSVLVAVDENMTDLITFGTEGLEKIDIKIGSKVEIVYDGVVMESYPGQIFARSWKLCENNESK